VTGLRITAGTGVETTAILRTDQDQAEVAILATPQALADLSLGPKTRPPGVMSYPKSIAFVPLASHIRAEGGVWIAPQTARRLEYRYGVGHL